MGRRRNTNHHLPRRVYFKHGQHYFVDKDNKWHPLGKDYLAAMIAYAELNQVKTPEITLGDVMDRYQVEIIPTKAERTQKDNLTEIKKLRAVFGEMHPDDVVPQDIYAYLDNRGAPVRANREISLLSHIYKKAIRWGVATRNPCASIEKNKESPRTRYVTDPEFWAVHDLSDHQIVKLAMHFAAITGLRTSDILDLKLSDFDEDENQGLYVTPQKTKRSTGNTLLFSWTKTLRQHFETARELPRPKNSEYLLCKPDGQPYTASGFKSIWQRLMRKALNEGLIKERYQFRDLRAKAGSDHEDGSLLGHADKRTLQRHYRRKPQKVEPISIKRKDEKDDSDGKY